jgi:hypothetical protein
MRQAAFDGYYEEVKIPLNLCACPLGARRSGVSSHGCRTLYSEVRTRGGPLHPVIRSRCLSTPSEDIVSPSTRFPRRRAWWMLN